ncbi:hypothetical protein TrLO_g12977 [Triparma laevis f. longispina]|uniref:Uncharacterized protein n=1 Tax=Triparma laevis f. longispina TaxID=1714387 RepID=A0A9W7FI54_9STRA|nr:hypothetical protein TrLO_g12977 [Triparma laevis f. longispina]
MFRLTAATLGRYSKMMDMGGVPLHKGNKELAKKLTGSLSKRLKVRGILLDYSCVSNVDPSQASSDSKPSSSSSSSSQANSQTTSGDSSFFNLPRHVSDMASVLGMNLSKGSEGVSIKREKNNKTAPHRDQAGFNPKSFLAGVEDEPQTVDTLPHSASPNSSSTPKPIPTSNHNPSADDIRSKYLKKLKEKKGISAKDILASDTSTPSQTPDSSFHLDLRSSIISSESTNDPNKYAATRWLPVNGMAKVLQYITSRSIRIGLLQPLTPGPLYQTGDVKTFKFQLGDKVDFDYSFDEAAPSQNLFNAIEGINVEKSDADSTSGVMVVSSCSNTLKSARDNNSYTVYIKPKSGRRCDISPNYNINSIDELRDVIDDVNGVSFNNARKVDFGIDHGGV